MQRSNISPSQLIQSGHVRCFLVTVSHGICTAPATDIIQGYEDRKYYESGREEDLEQSSKIAQEEIGIETAFLNEFGI
jgi:hypothetical protein